MKRRPRTERTRPGPPLGVSPQASVTSVGSGGDSLLLEPKWGANAGIQAWPSLSSDSIASREHRRGDGEIWAEDDEDDALIPVESDIEYLLALQRRLPVLAPPHARALEAQRRVEARRLRDREPPRPKTVGSRLPGVSLAGAKPLSYLERALLSSSSPGPIYMVDSGRLNSLPGGVVSETPTGRLPPKAPLPEPLPRARLNPGVYALTAPAVRRWFVGSHWDVALAQRSELIRLANGSHPCRPLVSYVQAHGIQGIRFRVLEELTMPKRAVDSRGVALLLDERTSHHQLKVRGKLLRAMDRQLRRHRLGYVMWHWVQILVAERSAVAFAAAITIQAAAKRRIATKRVRRMRRLRATRLIQRVYRGYLARRRVYYLRWDRAAAVVSRWGQRRFRGARGRRKAARLALRRAKKRGATALQKTWKGFVTRRQYALQRDWAMRSAAATTIQRRWRGLQGRARASRRISWKRQTEACGAVQRCWRGFLGRARTVRLREERRQRQAAQAIQEGWRCCLLRVEAKGVAEERREERRRVRAATKIQALSRGAQQRHRLVLKDVHGVRRAAAVRIQSLVRGHLCRQAARRARREDSAARKLTHWLRASLLRHRVLAAEQQEREEQAAVAIERASRLFIARRAVEGKREALRREAAVGLLQRVGRGMSGRLAAEAIRERRQRSQAAITLQSLARQRRARAEVIKRRRLLLVGPCLSCRDNETDLYCVDCEKELCDACHLGVVQQLVAIDGADPNHEVLDIDSYRIYCAAIQRIQAVFRGRQGRHRAACGACDECDMPGKVWCPYCQLKLCLCCASIVHSLSGMRSHVTLNLARHMKRDRAAKAIQRCWRGWEGRKLAAAVLQAKRARASQEIQRVWRGAAAREAVKAKRERETRASESMQRSTRLWLARLELNRRRVKAAEARRLAEEERRVQQRRETAAITLQRHARGMQARDRVAALRKELAVIEARRQLEFDSATLVQGLYRMWTARGRAEEKRRERDERVRATLRTAVAEQLFAQAEEGALELMRRRREQRAAAALTIQCCARSHRARSELRGKQEVRQFVVELLLEDVVTHDVMKAIAARHDNSIAIQALVRGFNGRQEAGRRRKERDERAQEEEERRVRAAVKIQAAFKGVLSRVQLKTIVEKVWQRHFDDSAQAFYYFHTVTEESQWVKPSLWVDPEPEVERTGWVEFFDEAAQAPYYYSYDTGEAVWERPDELGPPSPNHHLHPGPIDPSHPAPAASLWGEFWDEEQSAPYYYNSSTEESSWTKPLELMLVDDATPQWVQHWDEVANDYFYQNPATGDTMWTRPSTFLTLTSNGSDGPDGGEGTLVRRNSSQYSLQPLQRDSYQEVVDADDAFYDYDSAGSWMAETAAEESFDNEGVPSLITRGSFIAIADGDDPSSPHGIRAASPLALGEQHAIEEDSTYQYEYEQEEVYPYEQEEGEEGDGEQGEGYGYGDGGEAADAAYYAHLRDLEQGELDQSW